MIQIYPAEGGRNARGELTIGSLYSWAANNIIPGQYYSIYWISSFEWRPLLKSEIWRKSGFPL